MTVNIIYGNAGSFNRTAPTPVIRPDIVEDIANSGTSQATTAAAGDNATGSSGAHQYFVQITTDADIRIAIGESPTATPSDILILTGTTRDFALGPSERVAVIDA